MSVLLINSKVSAVAILGQLLITAVESLDLPAITTLLQRLRHLERRSLHLLVDVWRLDLVIVRVQTELVVSSVGIRFPLEFQSVRANGRSGFRIFYCCCVSERRPFISGAGR